MDIDEFKRHLGALDMRCLQIVVVSLGDGGTCPDFVLDHMKRCRLYVLPPFHGETGTPVKGKKIWWEKAIVEQGDTLPGIGDIHFHPRVTRTAMKWELS